VQLAFDQEITGTGKALATRLDETSFLEGLNKALKEMDDTGKLQELRDKWMQY
jgi:polar amino acid transport system substrate-binding protein